MKPKGGQMGTGGNKKDLTKMNHQYKGVCGELTKKERDLQILQGCLTTIEWRLMTEIEQGIGEAGDQARLEGWLRDSKH